MKKSNINLGSFVLLDRESEANRAITARVLAYGCGAPGYGTLVTHKMALRIKMAGLRTWAEPDTHG